MVFPPGLIGAVRNSPFSSFGVRLAAALAVSWKFPGNFPQHQRVVLQISQQIHDPLLQWPCFTVFTGLYDALYCVLQYLQHFTAHFTALYSPFYSTVKTHRAFLFTDFTDFTDFADNPLSANCWGKTSRTWFDFRLSSVGQLLKVAKGVCPNFFQLLANS